MFGYTNTYSRVISSGAYTVVTTCIGSAQLTYAGFFSFSPFPSTRSSEQFGQAAKFLTTPPLDARLELQEANDL